MNNLPSRFTLPFVKKELIKNNIYKFYFDRIAYTFDFFVGQYVRMELPLSQKDRQGNYRFLTICSSQNNRKEVAILVRIDDKPSVFKQQMLRLTPGKKVIFWGPSGNFYLPKKTVASSYTFIAGGVGIAPFLGMLDFLIEENQVIKVTLLVSFSSLTHIAFWEELKQLERQYSFLTVVYTITQDTKLPKTWQGEKGRITKTMINKYVKDINSSHFFVCGSIIMVANVSDMLLEMGVKSEHISGENFTGDDID